MAPAEKKRGSAGTHKQPSAVAAVSAWQRCEHEEEIKPGRPACLLSCSARAKRNLVGSAAQIFPPTNPTRATQRGANPRSDAAPVLPCSSPCPGTLPVPLLDREVSPQTLDNGKQLGTCSSFLSLLQNHCTHAHPAIQLPYPNHLLGLALGTPPALMAIYRTVASLASDYEE